MGDHTSYRRGRKNTFGVACCFALLLLCVPQLTTAATMTLLDDTFDTENGGVGQLNFFNLTNWNVNDGTVDLLGNGFFDFFPGSGLYLDLDGSTSNAATLQSSNSFSFSPGDIVTLTFDLAGPCSNISPICRNFQNINNGSNEVVVSLGSLFQETFSPGFDEPFQTTGEFFDTITRTISVNTQTAGTLAFAQSGADSIGLILDNVRLTVETPTSVPEPSTLSLFATALVGLGFFRWLCGRRSTQNTYRGS